LDRILSSMEEGFKRTDEAIAEMRYETTEIRNGVKAISKRQESEFKKMNTKLDTIKAGLGHNLEYYHKDFFYHYLKSKYPVKRSDFHVGVPLKINDKDYEVDLYLSTTEVTAVAEVTSFLDNDEMEKVKRFIEVFQSLKSKCSSSVVMGFFCALAVEPNILVDVMQLLDDNDITLIQGVALVRE